MATWGSPTDSGERYLFLGLLGASSALLAVLIVQLLLPWLLLGGALATLYWLMRQRDQRERQRHQLFYQLLQQQQGRISALDFAMAAQLTGAEARQFLDAKAQEFCGTFEPTSQGEIRYIFDVSHWRHSGSQPPRAQWGPIAEPPILEHTGPPTDNTTDYLSLEALAERLNCSVSLLQQHQWAADFAYWSQARDPEGRGWRIDSTVNRCYPLDRLASF